MRVSCEEFVLDLGLREMWRKNGITDIVGCAE